MSTAAMKVVSLIIAVLLLGIVVLWSKSIWEDYQRLQTMEAQFKASTEATTQVTGTLNTQAVERQRADTVVANRRAMSERRFEELKREDQTVADWAATAIPERLRELDSPKVIDGTSGAGVGSKTDDGAASGRGADKKSF